MLSNMRCNNLAVLGIGMGEDILDQVIAILIACDVDQRDSRTVKTSLADSIKIATEELRPADLETLLDNLRGELVHGIFGGIPNDVVDGPASVRRSTMFTNMLNAPVPKLAVGDDINVGKNFLNARTLVYGVSSTDRSKQLEDYG